MPLRPGWPPPLRLLQGTLGHAPPAAATLPLTTLAAPHSLHNSLRLSTSPSLCCSHSFTHYSPPRSPAPRRSHPLQHPRPPCYSPSAPLHHSPLFTLLFQESPSVTHSLRPLHRTLPFPPTTTPLYPSPASPPSPNALFLPLFSPPSPSPA